MAAFLANNDNALMGVEEEGERHARFLRSNAVVLTSRAIAGTSPGRSGPAAQKG
jgi:hypothetical protein